MWVNNPLNIVPKNKCGAIACACTGACQNRKVIYNNMFNDLLDNVEANPSIKETIEWKLLQSQIENALLKNELTEIKRKFKLIIEAHLLLDRAKILVERLFSKVKHLMD